MPSQLGQNYIFIVSLIGIMSLSVTSLIFFCQISIGLTSSLVVMPINMIIVQIFRKARPLAQDAPDPLMHWLKKMFRGLKRRVTPSSGKQRLEEFSEFNDEEKQHDKAVSEEVKTTLKSELEFERG